LKKISAIFRHSSGFFVIACHFEVRFVPFSFALGGNRAFEFHLFIFFRRERDLLRKVHESIDRGGKVVMPVFAVGRAQEVCILLET
jgi:Cft2 family RNA processing exonuclease